MVHSLVVTDQGILTFILFSLITLITYLFSLLLCACLACLRASLCAPTLAPRTLLAYQHTWLSLFFYFTLLSHQSFYFVRKFFFTKVFSLLPPGSCDPLFTFLYPFHLPDLLQPACFSACLRLFFLWPLLPLIAGWVGRTGVWRIAALLHTVRTIPRRRQ